MPGQARPRALWEEAALPLSLSVRCSVPASPIRQASHLSYCLHHMLVWPRGSVAARLAPPCQVRSGHVCADLSRHGQVPTCGAGTSWYLSYIAQLSMGPSGRPRQASKAAEPTTSRAVWRELERSNAGSTCEVLVSATCCAATDHQYSPVLVLAVPARGHQTGPFGSINDWARFRNGGNQIARASRKLDRQGARRPTALQRPSTWTQPQLSQRCQTRRGH